MAFNKKVLFPAQVAAIQVTDSILYSFSYGYTAPDSFALFRLDNTGRGDRSIGVLYNTLNTAAAGPTVFAMRRAVAFNIRDDDNQAIDLTRLGSYFAIVGDTFSCLAFIDDIGTGGGASVLLPAGEEVNTKYSAIYTLKSITGGDVVLTGKKIRMVIASRNDWESGQLPSGIRNIPALPELTAWGESEVPEAQQDFVLAPEDDTARSLSESRQFRFRNQTGLYNRGKFVYDGREYSVIRYELSRDERFVTVTGDRVVTTA